MPRNFTVINPLGRRLRDFNLTATDLASESGVSSRTITEYLAGRAEILDSHLTAFARVLECDPEDLYVA